MPPDAAAYKVQDYTCHKKHCNNLDSLHIGRIAVHVLYASELPSIRVSIIDSWINNRWIIRLFGQVTWFKKMNDTKLWLFTNASELVEAEFVLGCPLHLIIIIRMHNYYMFWLIQWKHFIALMNRVANLLWIPLPAYISKFKSLQTFYNAKTNNNKNYPLLLKLDNHHS